MPAAPPASGNGVITTSLGGVVRHREDKRASVADEWRYPMSAQTTRVSPRQGSGACISEGPQPWVQGGRCPTGASVACADGGMSGATQPTAQPGTQCRVAAWNGAALSLWDAHPFADASDCRCRRVLPWQSCVPRFPLQGQRAFKRWRSLWVISSCPFFSHLSVAISPPDLTGGLMRNHHCITVS